MLGYDVFAGTSPGAESSTPINGTTLITGTNYTVTGLAAGTTYYFTVQAVNAVGTSASFTGSVGGSWAPVELERRWFGGAAGREMGGNFLPHIRILCRGGRVEWGYRRVPGWGLGRPGAHRHHLGQPGVVRLIESVRRG